MEVYLSKQNIPPIFSNRYCWCILINMEATKTEFDTESFDSIIEDQPFLDSHTQEALIEWFGANDSIEPVFEDREEWEDREEILEKKEEGGTDKRKLYIPKDLNLFEMIDVVRVVDADTFKDNPELSTQGVEKIQQLADTFKKAGVYIDQSINYVDKGRDIAEELSKKFFNYGLSLESRTRQKGESIPPTVLSESEKRELDKWLIGKERYYKVMSGLGPNPSQEDIDKERERHFRVYFKALSSKGSKGVGDKVWKRSLSPVAKIHEKTGEGIRRMLLQPSREVYGMAFRRGMEKLKKEIDIPLATRDALEEIDDLINRDLKVEHRRLYNYLNVPGLKEELEDVRSRGDIEEISEKEFEIAERIREEINKYLYRKGSYNPSEVVQDNYLNCLGGTLLGSSLLDEIGIRYLYVFPYEHVMTFLLTSNGKLYWQDFTPEGDSRNGSEVRSDIFEGNPDLLTLAKNSDSFNVVYKVGKENYNISGSSDAVMASLMNYLGSILLNAGKPQEAMEMFGMGLEINPKGAIFYNNLGNALCALGQNEEAVDLYRQGIELQPYASMLYTNLGITLRELGRDEEAIEVYKKGLELNPDNTNLFKNYKKLADYLILRGEREKAGEVYNDLGVALLKIGRYEKAETILKKGLKLSPRYSMLYRSLGYVLYGLERDEEALEMYRKGIELNPNDYMLHNGLGHVLYALGRSEEAIEAYRQAIELNPNDHRTYYNLGVALESIGDVEGAEKVYREGLKIKPDTPNLQRRLENLLKVS